MHLVIGSDHRGILLKQKIAQYWMAQDVHVIDVHLTDKEVDSDQSIAVVDYPDVVALVAKQMKVMASIVLQSDNVSKDAGPYALNPMGVLICGSGIGVSIAANRYHHLYAALCRSQQDVLLARSHNNANVLCLGADYTSFEQAYQWTTAFATTSFQGGRHQRRIDKINYL